LRFIHFVRSIILTFYWGRVLQIVINIWIHLVRQLRGFQFSTTTFLYKSLYTHMISFLLLNTSQWKDGSQGSCMTDSKMAKLFSKLVVSLNTLIVLYESSCSSVFLLIFGMDSLSKCAYSYSLWL
jgi:hypothetical protein